MPHTHPLAEVFGYPTDNFSPDAERYRSQKLCPYNNRVPNCTKDRAEDPLGVCSVFDHDLVTVTCPVRLRQDWLIASDAASFFFPAGTTWTSLTEVRLNDRHGRSAGNIDVVLVAYDSAGRLTDFGSIEVQAVYISGNVRTAFAHYMENPKERAAMDWTRRKLYPRPDYLSSSRKRLAPQLLFKGSILRAWGKKQAVIVDQPFFDTLPAMEEVEKEDAELAWLVYELRHDTTQNRYQQVLSRVVYTRFKPALDRLTLAEPGDADEFVAHLQSKLDEKLDSGGGSAPDAPALGDYIGG